MRYATEQSKLSHTCLECSADVRQAHVCADVSQSRVCADVSLSHVYADVMVSAAHML